MNRVNFFSGQKVSAEDLNYLQEVVCGQVEDRTALQFSKGVISDVGIYAEVDDGQTLRINALQAFTNSGKMIQIVSPVRRLALDLTDSTNRELGTQGILSDDDFGWEEDTLYTIAIKYIEAGGRPRPHYRTRVAYPTRIYTGFKVYAFRKGVDSLEVGGVNPYIVIAEAIYQNGALSVYTEGITEYAGLDASKARVDVGTKRTSNYDISGSVTVADHVRCIGDANAVSNKNPHGLTLEILGVDANAVPQHEKNFHANGFLGDYSNTNSCFYTTVDAVSGTDVDYLVVHNITSPDSLHNNGKTTNSYDYVYNDGNSNIIPDSIYIQLSQTNSGVTTVLPDGIYDLYIDLASRKIVVGYRGSILIPCTYNIFVNINGYQAIETGIPLVSSSSISDTNCYRLYSVHLSGTKTVTNIPISGGVIASNFTNLVDYRTFGSISVDNLQKDPTGAINLKGSVAVSSIVFNDGSTITSGITYPANYISHSLKFDSVGTSKTSSIIIYPGVCRDSTNKVLITIGNSRTKDITATWRAGNGGCLPPNIGISQGTWHIFAIANEAGVGDIAIDRDITASNLVSSTGASPISGYKYFRRIGSIYVLNGNVVLPFKTIPNGNGLTVMYQMLGELTLGTSNLVLPVPSMQYIYWNATTNSWVPSSPALYYQNLDITLNISATSNLGIKSKMMQYGGQLAVLPALTPNIGNMNVISATGDLDFTNLNGTNGTITANVVSYYDARID